MTAFILQPGLGYNPETGVNAAEHRRTLRMYLWQKSKGLCALCGLAVDPIDVHADHIIPRSRGGSDGVHNLQATHKPCNSGKRDRMPEGAVPPITEPVEYAPQPLLIHENAGPFLPLSFMTVSEVAVMQGVAEETVRRWLRSKKLRGTSLGRGAAGWRIRPADLQAFLNKRTD